jgi:outer membrane protein assembly factor BamB
MSIPGHRHLSLLLLGFLLLSPKLAAGHWPQYRGVQAGGVDTNGAAPVSWNVATRSKVLWQTDIPGFGHSSPILWDDRIYVTTAVTAGKAELKVGLYGDINPVNEKETHHWKLLAMDRTTGTVVWDSEGLAAIPRVKRHPKSSPCNSTPATDGRHIVALFGSEGLFCFDSKGKLLWKKDLGPMDSGYYEVPSAQWGFASSPVIHDGKIIVQVDVQKESFLAVYDLESGNLVWRTPRSDVPTWSTPTVVKSGETTQIVVNGWHHTGGYDFTNGSNLWHLDGGGDIPVPTPIYANGLIYLTSAHGKSRPMRAVRPTAKGNITPDEVGDTTEFIVWAHARQGNYMQTPIAVGNLVYGCLDIGLLTCFDGLTGKIRYSERLSNVGEGFTSSPVSDGRNLFFASETGKVYVVPATGTFSVTSTNSLNETCMSTPALVDGTLYYRTRSQLVAIGAR